MRAATFFITILAIAPSFTFAAPIGAAHYEELEARWNPFHLNAQQQQKVQKLEHGVRIDPVSGGLLDENS